MTDLLDINAARTQISSYIQSHVKSGNTINTVDLEYREPAEPVVLNNCGNVSIQASAYHYCSPRHNDGPYTHFEIGYPSDNLDLSAILPYKEDLGNSDSNSVYAGVPLEAVLEFLIDNGGVYLTQEEIKKLKSNE